MPISFRCPHCQKSLKAPSAAVGRKAKCPSCGGSSIVPQPKDKPPANEDVYDAKPLAKTPPQANQKHWGFEDEDEDGGGEYRLPPSETPFVPPPALKPCPACGEMIQAVAVKCRFCGEVLDPAMKKVAKKKKRKSRSSDDDSDLSATEWIAALILPDCACIFGVIWMIQGKQKGLKMLGAMLAGLLVRIGIMVAASNMHH